MAKLKKSDNDALVDEVRERIEQSYQADQTNREEAATDLAFVAGDQWPDKIRREREAEDRPALTINRLPQFIRQITNDIRQADIAIKVVGEDDETDPELAEIYDGLIRQIQYRSSAGHVFSTAAEHQVSCGIGWFRVLTDYVHDMAWEQEIKIEGVRHPLSVYCDPAAVKPDRSDASWIALTEMVPRATFKERYPKAAETDVDKPANGYEGSAFFWDTQDDIRIAEYWKKVPVDKVIGLTPDGQTIDVTDMADEFRAMLDIQKTRKVKSHKVVQYIVSGAEILEGPFDWAGKYIPIVPVIGGETPLNETIYRYSAIRFARDPQILYNFERTAMAEKTGQSPKTPYIVTPAMLKGFKSLWDTANRKLRPYLPYNPDPEAPGAKPYREQSAPVESGHIAQANLASEDMKATTGIYDAALGAGGNETSGVAIGRRQIEADTANFHFADNLQLSLEHTGRILVDLIPKIYDSERVLRLRGDQPSKDDKVVTINQTVMGVDGVPMLINDLSAGSFDVRVTVGRSYQTRRQEQADSMTAFIQAVPSIAPVVLDIYAGAMDWPEADEISKRLKNLIPPEALRDPDEPQQPDPAAIAAQEAQLLEITSKAEKTQADAAKSAADAEGKQLENAISLMQVTGGGLPMPGPANYPG